MPNKDAPQEHKRSARLAAMASRQWGCVTVAQLLALGFSRGEIRGMREKGLLIQMHRGVYVLGALSPAPEQRWAAALLAAGNGAALSHTAAEAHYGLLPPRDVIEVSAPATNLVPVDDPRAFAAQRRGARGAARLAEAAGEPLTRSRMEARALRMKKRGTEVRRFTA